MLTQQDLFVIAKDQPAIMPAFYKAVNAIIEYRKEIATKKSGLRAKSRLKKKQFAASSLMMDFADGFVFNGKPISEAEKMLVRQWIIETAKFRFLSKEVQNKVLMHACQYEISQAEWAKWAIIESAELD